MLALYFIVPKEFVFYAPNSSSLLAAKFVLTILRTFLNIELTTTIIQDTLFIISFYVKNFVTEIVDCSGIKITQEWNTGKFRLDFLKLSAQISGFVIKSTLVRQLGIDKFAQVDSDIYLKRQFFKYVFERATSSFTFIMISCQIMVD